MPTRKPTTRTIHIVRTNEQNAEVGVDEVVLIYDQPARMNSTGDNIVVTLTENSSENPLYAAIPSSGIFDDETLCVRS
ncbi:hypothetical protein HK098_004443 [Nowakowskiella sp. JEL0407]|nr:hypothetical protein HK098_004443 [Nowakowskiella sp. JEL0407]